MRIAVIDKEHCKSNKCSKECINVCPRNRAGDKCVWLGNDKKSRIDEDICIGCGLCVKKCPFKAISVVNTPEQLKESPIHRFGDNGFVLFRLPFPIKGQVVGLLGPNGVGKTTALSILSGTVKPNLGGKDGTEEDLVKIFRGTELQDYLEKLGKGKVTAVVKPQQVDILKDVDGTVQELLKKHDERGKSEEIIKKLGMEGFLDRTLDKLSGGELQRVAIAIAVSRKADVYYFDELSSYMDVFQRLNAAKLIRELAQEADVIVVEHDLATLDFLADRIHVFYGVPGVYGIVSKPYSTRVGINAFLDGMIKEDNVRIREEALDFTVPKMTDTTESEIMLEWSEITKKFSGFSMKINPGSLRKKEVIGIFGSNALGKTTFARILAGELEADSGELSTEAKISYKPQYIHSNYDGTVMELLMTVCNPHAEDFKSDVLRPLQLEHLLDNIVSKLSGGELQRVSIALCLGKKADIYLMDEPSAYIDSEQRLHAAKAIRKFCEKRECSAMIIDHDLLFLSYISDTSIVFTGTPSAAGEAWSMALQEGMNKFLKEVDITFRKDPQTHRPRANKPGSQKEQEQKSSGKYFFV